MGEACSVVKAIQRQNAKRRPNRGKRSPAPAFHTASKRARLPLFEAYRWLEAAYREAADRLRAGDREATFPEGSFPPPLPFVVAVWPTDRRHLRARKTPCPWARLVEVCPSESNRGQDGVGSRSLRHGVEFSRGTFSGGRWFHRLTHRSIEVRRGSSRTGEARVLALSHGSESLLEAAFVADHYILGDTRSGISAKTIRDLN